VIIKLGKLNKCKSVSGLQCEGGTPQISAGARTSRLMWQRDWAGGHAGRHIDPWAPLWARNATVDNHRRWRELLLYADRTGALLSRSQFLLPCFTIVRSLLPVSSTVVWILLLWSHPLLFCRMTATKASNAKSDWKQDCLSVEGRPPTKAFSLLWPWPWPDHLYIRTWPVWRFTCRSKMNIL